MIQIESFKNLKEEELIKVAQKIKKLLKDFFIENKRACILFLEGDLGAGKTTFVKKLGKVLNIKDTIISPTFILRKDYENLIHIDGYRFEKEEEGKILALDLELGKEGKIILIEWPERFTKKCKIHPDITLQFEWLNETERDVTILKH